MKAWLTRHHSNSFSPITFHSIHHFQIDHSAPCSQSNILHNHCFLFLMGITAVPREIEEIWEGGAWGEANKVHYGLFGNAEMVTEMNPYPFVTRNLKFRYYNSTKLLRTFPFYRFQLFNFSVSLLLHLRFPKRKRKFLKCLLYQFFGNLQEYRTQFSFYFN